LYENQISDIAVLGAAIAKNSSLTDLVLSENKFIGSLKPLVDAFATNITLRSLVVRFTLFFFANNMCLAVSAS
jgi:hypothetical protein